MGQYWKPVVEGKDGKRYSIISHQFNNGLKFMEHSYIGNILPSIIMWKLYKNPMFTTWVGDYCDERLVGNGLKGPTGSELWDDRHIIYFTNASSRPIWLGIDEDMNCNTEELSDETMKQISEMFDNNIADYILVNHTKRMYLSFEEYMQIPYNLNSRLKDWELKIHPLPVLVAAPSMGDGMGDFHAARATNYNKVGTWSWDLISVEDKSYAEVSKYTFVDKVRNFMYKITDFEFLKSKKRKLQKCDINKYYFDEVSNC